MARFEQTYCSNCGGEFGPGDNGYSHCDQHKGLINRDESSPAVKKAMDRFNSALARRRAYGPPSRH